jgi:hypothetical protein
LGADGGVDAQAGKVECRLPTSLADTAKGLAAAKADGNIHLLEEASLSSRPTSGGDPIPSNLLKIMPSHPLHDREKTHVGA